MNGKKALLLVGSPRGLASVSHSLGDHLLSLLEQRGLATKKLLLYPALNDEKKMSELLSAVDACSLLVLAIPLYVDHLPAPVIDLLQRVVERRQGQQAAPTQALAAIVNCGFPKPPTVIPPGTSYAFSRNRLAFTAWAAWPWAWAAPSATAPWPRPAAWSATR